MVECDKDCSKAYNKLLTEKIHNEKDEQSKALMSKRLAASSTLLQDGNSSQSTMNSVRQSKKRRRDDFEPEMSDSITTNIQP